MDDDWPVEGKVGLATAGEYDGQFVFVFPEEPGFWGFYTSRGGDDAIPDADFIENRIRAAKVVWLVEPEESIVERAVFAMRPLGVAQPTTFKQFRRRVRGDYSWASRKK